jgi:hypothetical protein
MIEIKRGQGYSNEELAAFLKASRMDNRSRNFRWALAFLFGSALIFYNIYKKHEKSPIEPHKEGKQAATKPRKENKEGEKK